MSKTRLPEQPGQEQDSETLMIISLNTGKANKRKHPDADFISHALR